MDVASVFGVVAAAAAIAFIVWTMPVGKRLAARLGVPQFGQVRASRPQAGDHQYLLRACGGDTAELERRLGAERARFSELGEADIYRRAIRTYMNSRPQGEDAGRTKGSGDES
jgi:hypothetical protein